ncbi:MAG: 3-hydroxyacyl-CoA dehydrogenase NAD-binding domain-containing protein, partial [Bdellovibrionota bacterium]
QTRFFVDQEHAEIVFDSPDKKVNVLNRQCFEELAEYFAILKSKASEIKTLLIYSAKPGMFLAGADIQEIFKMTTEQEAYELVSRVQDLFFELESLPQVKMVAVDGPCMGGGLELSLCCDFILASDSANTQLGLPEVKLGVIPGAGGTQRLPLRVGLQQAITMITSGAGVYAKKALKIGLIDDIVPLEKLLEVARMRLRDGSYRKYNFNLPMIEKLKALPPLKNYIYKQAKKEILKKTRGHYPAVMKAVEVIEETFGAKDPKPGFLVEAKAFAGLAITPTSKNLIHIFFASEDLKKEIGVSPMQAPDFKPTKVERLGVLGAGIMGGGIAAVAASKKMKVQLKDVSHDSIKTALKTAHSLFEKDFKKKKVDLAETRMRSFRIKPSLEWNAYRYVDFVIEAVVENLEIKKRVLEELESKVAKDTIIASNTSSLRISEMAEVLKRPENFVGMHFFNPVPLMPLVEVIQAEKTDPVVVAETVAFAKQLGKTPIVVKDRPGFLVNRILMPFLIEAGHLRQDGYGILQIDQAALDFGMPMGPFRLLDEIGLDTAAKVADVIASAFPHMKVTPLIHEMVNKGYLGKKNGKGFYLYDQKGRDVGVRPEFQTSPRDPSAATLRSIQDRLILPMLSEAIMTLDEGTVSSIRDLDLGLIYGIGFPPFRGGILKWASDVGESEILERLQGLHNSTKGRFNVVEGLKNRVQAGQTFYR